MRCRVAALVIAPVLAIAFSIAPSTFAGAEPVAKKLFGKKKAPASMRARSIGSYARGCLAGGRMLPVSGAGWEAMKLWRNRNWGHPVLIEFLERFATESTEIDGWPGLLIGDLSQPRGGPMLTGHRSHQIGLDADIWYRPKPDGPMSEKERSDSWSIPLAGQFSANVNKKHWKSGYVTLIKRAASYRETARIFVHPAVKRALCEGAGDDRAWLRKVRPWWKHNYHFHVRLRCPPGVAGCKDQDPPPVGDGCGAQIDHWMKKLAAAEKWSKQKPKPPVKKKPRKELRMADLPPSCRAVLDAGPIVNARARRLPDAPQRKPDAPTVQPAAVTASPGGPGLPWRKKAITRNAAPAAVPLPVRKPQ
ncbi:MAG: penicillin-insensitive murein endopeptidase [Hyphomicrobiaceae bacterium]|nr:penicillin-insensitive murein endopeptidase [Hyphomicrobiaceae bacterium]